MTEPAVPPLTAERLAQIESTAMTCRGMRMADHLFALLADLRATRAERDAQAALLEAVTAKLSNSIKEQARLLRRLTKMQNGEGCVLVPADDYYDVTFGNQHRAEAAEAERDEARRQVEGLKGAIDHALRVNRTLVVGIACDGSSIDYAHREVRTLIGQILSDTLAATTPAPATAPATTQCRRCPEPTPIGQPCPVCGDVTLSADYDDDAPAMTPVENDPVGQAWERLRQPNATSDDVVHYRTVHDAAVRQAAEKAVNGAPATAPGSEAGS